MGTFLMDCFGSSPPWAGVEGTCQLIFVGVLLPSRWLLWTEDNSRQVITRSSDPQEIHTFVPTKSEAQADPEAAASLYSVIRTGYPPSVILQALIRRLPADSDFQDSEITRRHSRLS